MVSIGNGVKSARRGTLAVLIHWIAPASKDTDAATLEKLDLERLKAAIRAQLDRPIAVNETRVDLREQFESLIDEYNSGSSQIEQLFLELLKLSRNLTDEEARHVREQLSEEELVVFDLLTRPGPDSRPRSATK